MFVIATERTVATPSTAVQPSPQFRLPSAWGIRRHGVGSLRVSFASRIFKGSRSQKMEPPARDSPGGRSHRAFKGTRFAPISFG
jgi:hypothetical protein